MPTEEELQAAQAAQREANAQAARGAIVGKANLHADVMLKEVERFAGQLPPAARTSFFETFTTGLALLEDETSNDRAARQATETVNRLNAATKGMAPADKAEFLRVLRAGL